jgi:hypothetical protein
MNGGFTMGFSGRLFDLGQPASAPAPKLSIHLYADSLGATIA